jgi:hypothetical protein
LAPSPLRGLIGNCQQWPAFTLELERRRTALRQRKAFWYRIGWF